MANPTQNRVAAAETELSRRLVAAHRAERQRMSRLVRNLRLVGIAGWVGSALTVAVTTEGHRAYLYMAAVAAINWVLVAAPVLRERKNPVTLWTINGVMFLDMPVLFIGLYVGVLEETDAQLAALAGGMIYLLLTSMTVLTLERRRLPLAVGIAITGTLGLHLLADVHETLMVTNVVAILAVGIGGRQLIVRHQRLALSVFQTQATINRLGRYCSQHGASEHSMQCSAAAGGEQ